MNVYLLLCFHCAIKPKKVILKEREVEQTQFNMYLV